MHLVFSFKIHSKKYLLNNHTFNDLLDYALFLNTLNSNIFGASIYDSSFYQTKRQLVNFIIVFEESLCQLCSVTCDSILPI